MSKTTFEENDLPETAEVTGSVEEIYNPENKDSKEYACLNSSESFSLI